MFLIFGGVLWLRSPFLGFLMHNMTDKKQVVASEVIPMMSQITYHKLNGLNYLDWDKTIMIYLRSINMDDHLIKDDSIDDSRIKWIQKDARFLLQNRNSIDSELLGEINHCEFVK